MKYKCRLCGYIYDPAAATRTTASPLEPRLRISDDWVLPDCGAGKDQFEPADD